MLRWHSEAAQQIFLQNVSVHLQVPLGLHHVEPFWASSLSSGHSVIRHIPGHEGEQVLWLFFDGCLPQKAKMLENNADTVASDAGIRPC